jgi:phage shock protein E
VTRLRALLGAGVATVALAACSGSSADLDAIDLAEAVVIDVRTPGEFAERRLEGALNLSLETGALSAALPTLDPSVDYVVYCRSGRRSEVAADLMRAAGITSLVDLGSFDNAARATGFDVIP